MRKLPYFTINVNIMLETSMAISILDSFIQPPTKGFYYSVSGIKLRWNKKKLHQPSVLLLLQSFQVLGGVNFDLRYPTQKSHTVSSWVSM